MKLATYEAAGGAPRLAAVLDDGALLDLAAAAEHAGLDAERRGDLASMRRLIDGGPAALDAVRELLRDPAEEAVVRGARLLAPLRPRQMRDCLTFERHLKQAVEQHVRGDLAGEPDPEAAFRKLAAAGALAIPPVWYEQPIYYKCNRFSVIGHEQDIRWPSYSEKMDYELELAAVIGRTGRDIAREDAPAHIFGYTIYNDVSARDAQFREMPGRLGPAKGKDFDTGNVLGPWIVTADEFDPYDRAMVVRVNGEERGRGHSGEMQHRFDRILEHISRDETLYAGEVIGSGTVGNGCGAEFSRFLEPGDVIELEIEGIGVLRNRIVRPAAAGEERP